MRLPLRLRSVRLPGVLALLVLLAAAVPARAQIFKLPQPDTTAGNFFGNATAIDGDRALVGASGEHDCAPNAGAAYIFERDPGGGWRQVARLTPSDCKEDLFFGRSVALSGDRALVAASGEFFSNEASNAAYVFERDPATGQWQQTARLTVGTPLDEGAFAASVSLDGDRALITTTGDPMHGRYSGAAYIFERDPDTDQWVRVARLTGSGDVDDGIFGGAGVIQGDRAVVTASTYFAYEPGSVYLFERDPDTGRWQEAAHFGGIDDFFISVALDGAHVLVGESKARPDQAGAATLYTRDSTGTWQHTTTLRPKTPYPHGAFGTAVALHGEHALVVGYDEQLGLDFNVDRVVYVFQHDPAAGTWRQRHIIDIGEVAFGSALDYDGRLALIGNASDRRPGTAYVVPIW